MQKYEVKVSIIVPIYNSERYLKECLDSVRQQSIPDFEVILINDGSTDASLEIAAEFSKNDSRFTVITIDNSGPSIARNTGIDIASGEYIMFLDSDDMHANNAIKTALNRCIDQQLDIYFFSAISIYDHDSSKIKESYYSRGDSISKKIINGECFFSNSIYSRTFIASPCLFIAKTSIIKHIKFQPNILHEDNLFMAELLLNTKTKRVLAENKDLYIRRRREGSITSKYNDQRALDSIAICNGLLKIKKDPSTSKIAKKSLGRLITSMLKNASENFYYTGKRGLTLKQMKLLFNEYVKSPENFLDTRVVLIIFFPDVYYFLKKMAHRYN